MSMAFDRYETAPQPWIGGVCAAIAGLSGIAPWIIRLAAFALLLWHPLWFIVLYLAAVAFIRNGNSPIARRLRWFSRRYPPAPDGGAAPGLAALARQLAALDRRLANLEATIGTPDDTLKQKFRNL